MASELADVLCVSSLLKDSAPIQKWLSQKKERLLLVIEEELFIPMTFRPHPREKSVYKEDQERLKQLAWEFVFLRTALADHTALPEEKRKEIEKVYEEFSRWKLGIDLLASDYKERGVPQWKNLLANVLRLREARLGRELFGKFEGIPAIICGAGPSLDHSLKALGTLQEKALLFAGGSALTALSHAHVLPHFAAAIDPDPPLSRFLQDSSFEVPFFYQDRLSKEIFKRRHSSLLWIEGNGGFPIEEWLHGSGTFDGGWNVATFCTALACAMGCNPIYFVGVDLAPSENCLYASGIEEEGTSPKKDWLMASEWLQEYIEAHPEKKFIKVDHSISLERQFARSFDLSGKVHATLERIPKIAKETDQLTKELQNSLEICAQKCDQLLRIIEKEYPQVPFSKGEFVLHEVEFEEQIAYENFLEPIWKIWHHVFVREITGDPQLGLYINKLLFMREICHELSNHT